MTGDEVGAWRRRSIVVIVGAMLAAVLSLLVQGTAHACSCMQPDPAAEVAAADVVFVGTPVASEHTSSDDETGRAMEPVDWTFQVDTVHRGTATATTTVGSAADSAACGITFRTGEKYLVLGNVVDGQLRAGLCGGTGLLANADADRLDLIGAGAPPQPDPVAAPAPEASASTTWLVIAGVGVSVLIAGAVVLARLRRRPGTGQG